MNKRELAARCGGGAARVVCIGVVALLVGVTHGAPGARSATTRAGQPAGAGRGIGALLQPWQAVDPTWAERAEVIVAGTCEFRRGPCIFIPDGPIVMPSRPFLKLDRPVKGKVGVNALELEYIEAGRADVPPFLVQGRRYLVFVKPTAETARRLGSGPVRLSSGDVVAMVDLSAGRAEVEGLTTKATESGEFEGFRFTPQKWTALRGKPAVDLREQNRFLPFLRHEVLKARASLKAVRSFLGDPDYQTVDEHDELECTYTLASDDFDTMQVGEVVCHVKVRFDGKRELVYYDVSYTRYVEERVGKQISRGTTVLSAEELKQLGLEEISEDFRGGGK